MPNFVYSACRTTLRYVPLIAIALSVVACSTRPRTSGTVVQPQAQTQPPMQTTPINTATTQKLAGQWTLKALPSASGVVMPVPINFNNGQASGSDGCNNIGVRYQGGERGEIQFDTNTMVATRMACRSPDIQNFSSSYLQTLSEVRNYRINANILSLYTADMRPLAVYEAHTSSTITGSEWKIVGYNNGKGGVVSTSSPDTMRINFGANGNVGVFAGCNASVGRYTVDGVTGQMTISNLVNSRKKCPQSTMAVENAILNALPRVATYTQTANGVELRSANGSLQMLLQTVR